ncbi:MAG: hypothetical protein LRZ84_19470 [Desertifilum sp.]|nr:hypothetical protein [Desertifilum sp.]
MLAYILAFAVGLGSLVLYTAALFFPEVYRKGDFIWSGVGLFYALVLWVCAGQIRGGLLLGQTASVALLGWLGWQTLMMRRALTPSVQQTPVSEDLPVKLIDSLKQLPQRLTGKLKPTAPVKTTLEKPSTVEAVVTPEDTATVVTPEDTATVVTPETLEDTATPETPEDIAAVATPETPIDAGEQSPDAAISTPADEAPENPEPPAVKPTEVKSPTAKKPQSKAFAQAGRLVSFVKTRLAKKPKAQPTSKPFPTTATPPAAETSIDDDFDFGDLEETSPVDTTSVDASEAPTVPEVVPPAEALNPPETVEVASVETHLPTAEQEVPSATSPETDLVEPAQTSDSLSSSPDSPDSEEVLQRPNSPDPDLVEAAQTPEDTGSEASQSTNSASESSPEERKET